MVKKWRAGPELKSSFCSEGWSDFEKNATLSMLFQIDVGPPIPKCCVLMLPFHFVAGPQKISNCYSTVHSNEQTKLYLIFLKVSN